MLAQSIDALNEDNASPLCLASESENLPVIRALLDAGATVKNGRKPVRAFRPMLETEVRRMQNEERFARSVDTNIGRLFRIFLGKKRAIPL